MSMDGTDRSARKLVDIGLLADPTRCPDCAIALPGTPSECPACGLPLRGHLAE
jgi:predicted amidophosphoribosyltransferase